MYIEMIMFIHPNKGAKNLFNIFHLHKIRVTGEPECYMLVSFPISCPCQIIYMMRISTTKFETLITSQAFSIATFS